MTNSENGNGEGLWEIEIQGEQLSDEIYSIWDKEYYGAEPKDTVINAITNHILSKIQTGGKRYTQADLVKARKQGYEQGVNDAPILDEFGKEIKDNMVEKAIGNIATRIHSLTYMQTKPFGVDQEISFLQKIQSTLKGES